MPHLRKLRQWAVFAKIYFDFFNLLGQLQGSDERGLKLELLRMPWEFISTINLESRIFFKCCNTMSSTHVDSRANDSSASLHAQIYSSAPKDPVHVETKASGFLIGLQLSRSLSMLNNLELARASSDQGFSWPIL